MPIDATGRAAAELVRSGTLAVYEGGSHGVTDTRQDRLNADLLAFATS